MRVAFGARGFDVVADHALDALFAAGGVSEVVAEFDRDHFGQVFMLRDGEDFFFGEFGKFDTVLNR